jgi:hypothetical protein
LRGRFSYWYFFFLQVMQERPDQVCTFIADFLRELESTETETLDM